MRSATDIQVEQAIIHRVFRDDCVLSETLLPASGPEGIVSYLRKDIENGLHDPSARAARFAVLDDSLVSGLCNGLLTDRIGLVDGSRQLAQRLHDIVRRDTRIADGVLAVCLYLATGTTGRVRYLAILKLDSREALRFATRRNEEGKLCVGLQSEPDLMPPVEQNRNKCAFVRCVDLRAEYDMILLDRQAGTGRPSPIANYFAEAFLGARVVEPPKSFPRGANKLYSCFISYSSKDQDFANKLHMDLLSNKVQCWFAPHDMPIGARLRPTIHEKERQQDKVLIILSSNALASHWVEDEVEVALARERDDPSHAIVLFPIRLDDAVMQAQAGWAATLCNNRHIGDFRQWQDDDAYRESLQRLLRDLKTCDARQQEAAG